MHLEAMEMDRHCRRTTLYRFDPRAKLAAALVLIVSVSFLKDISALLLALGFAISLAVISRLPLGFLARSFVLTLPFILFAALTAYLTAGAVPAAGMVLRISTSVLLLLVLVSTTPFFELLKALRWYRVPQAICSLLLFTYRYLFVLVDEMDRMSMARKARGFSGRGNLLSKDVFKTISNTAGMVMVRSYGRAKRIYEALMSRGYDGEIRTMDPLRMRGRDVAYLVVFISVAILAVCIQVGVIDWTLFS